jgi:hypothetical protein
MMVKAFSLRPRLHFYTFERYSKHIRATLNGALGTFQIGGNECDGLACPEKRPHTIIFLRCPRVPVVLCHWPLFRLRLRPQLFFAPTRGASSREV